MKLVAISDLHLDRVTAGVPRRDEIASVLDAASEHAVSWKADALVFLGDLANPDAGSGVIRCVWEALGAARFLHKNGVDTYWLTGNHDVIEDGTGHSTLTPLVGSEGAHVSVRPELLMVGDGMLLTLPFPPRLLDYDPTAEVYRLAGQWAPTLKGTPVVVASHLMVPGMHPGSETTEMARGRDVGLPIEALKRVGELHPLLVLQGHYHRGGLHVVDGLEVHVVGAPARMARDEADDREPGFLTVEV